MTNVLRAEMWIHEDYELRDAKHRCHRLRHLFWRARHRTASRNRPQGITVTDVIRSESRRMPRRVFTSKDCLEWDPRILVRRIHKPRIGWIPDVAAPRDHLFAQPDEEFLHPLPL